LIGTVTIQRHGKILDEKSVTQRALLAGLVIPYSVATKKHVNMMKIQNSLSEREKEENSARILFKKDI
jgi:hypothetical protein